MSSQTNWVDKENRRERIKASLALFRLFETRFISLLFEIVNKKLVSLEILIKNFSFRLKSEFYQKGCLWYYRRFLLVGVADSSFLLAEKIRALFSRILSTGELPKDFWLVEKLT